MGDQVNDPTLYKRLVPLIETKLQKVPGSLLIIFKKTKAKKHCECSIYLLMKRLLVTAKFTLKRHIPRVRLFLA